MTGARISQFRADRISAAELNAIIPWWYVLLVAATGAQRLREVAISTRRERGLVGRRAAARSYPLMVVSHVGLFTLPLLETAILRPRRSRTVAAAAITMLVAATALRWWSMHSLGRWWNVKAVVPDDLEPVQDGPYRYIRHPNYLAVIVEFVAVPMAAGAWRSMLLLSALNSAVLVDRIGDEERLLERNSVYRNSVGRRARFIPGLFQ